MNIENKKQIAIIFIAIVLGLVAAVLTGNHINQSIQKETALLAKQYQEKTIKPLMQTMDGMARKIDDLEKKQKQISVMAMTQGGGKGTSSETPPVPKSSLALRTPPGKRALTVRIDSLSAVGGMINPGDYIDIIAHLKVPSPRKGGTEEVTATVFQNIQVLAVGINLQAPGGYEAQAHANALNITIAVEPEEAGLMMFTQKNGRLQLTLRGPAETEARMLQAATWQALSDYVLDRSGMELVVPQSEAVIEAKGEPQVETEIKPYIQIFRGGREL